MGFDDDWSIEELMARRSARTCSRGRTGDWCAECPVWGCDVEWWEDRQEREREEREDRIEADFRAKFGPASDDVIREAVLPCVECEGPGAWGRETADEAMYDVMEEAMELCEPASRERILELLSRRLGDEEMERARGMGPPELAALAGEAAMMVRFCGGAMVIDWMWYRDAWSAEERRP
jgi:hypothetical protein